MAEKPADGEGAEGEEKDIKAMADQLSAAREKAEAVTIDAKMLEGRKANRALTVSMGKGNADVDVKDLRRDKRAQTLPNFKSRRADIQLSPESQRALLDRQELLKARFRRGSVSVFVEASKDEDLEETWTTFALCHVHGKMTEGQAPADERERVSFIKEEPLGDPPPIIMCTKGCKGIRDTTPNQDNYSITNFKNGWNLCCVFDGHGPNGHHVSYWACKSLPYFLTHSKFFPEKMEEALKEAFENAHKDVVAHAVLDEWDVQASGTTAVAALWKGNQVWTANVGDSRCVIGTEAKRKILYETMDHKPNSPAEQARIEAAGGEVRSQVYPDGWTAHRIFVRGQDYPGLCMARTIGDEIVKSCGVVPTPEVGSFEVDLSDKPFLIIASDGVWEFLDSEFVVKAVAKKIESDGPAKTVQKLQREARKRWRQEEGEYCDDVTSILIQLR